MILIVVVSLVISSVDGVRIKSYGELTAEIDSHEVGDVVELKAYRYYDRNGKLLEEYEEHTFVIEIRVYE